jgi:DNA-binding response OmpR family regulator
MISFKHELLERVREGLAQLPSAGQLDVVEHDVALLEDQLERYQRRLRFWFDRQWELEGLEIDRKGRTISHQERSASLTNREFQIFSLLVSWPDRYFTPQQLLAEAWHDTRLPYESLRTYVGRLRKKLDQLEAGCVVVNRPKRGYAIFFRERPARRIPSGEPTGDEITLR